MHTNLPSYGQDVVEDATPTITLSARGPFGFRRSKNHVPAVAPCKLLAGGPLTMPEASEGPGDSLTFASPAIRPSAAAAASAPGSGVTDTSLLTQSRRDAETPLVDFTILHEDHRAGADLMELQLRYAIKNRGATVPRGVMPLNQAQACIARAFKAMQGNNQRAVAKHFQNLVAFAPDYALYVLVIGRASRVMRLDRPDGAASTQDFHSFLMNEIVKPGPTSRYLSVPLAEADGVPSA